MSLRADLKLYFRMNEIPIELCERENYKKTMEILTNSCGKRGSLRRLESFIHFKSKENVKPKSKLSFDVRIKLFFIEFEFCILDKYG